MKGNHGKLERNGKEEYSMAGGNRRESSACEEHRSKLGNAA
jgi:hypothetical protein